MNRAARAIWVAKVDMEALISAMLRWGILLSVGLTMAGLLCRGRATPEAGVSAPLQGENLFHLILADWHRAGSPGQWPVVLMHGGIAVLFLAPYGRVVISTLYFACVERSGRHAVLTGLVLLLVTYMLFFG